MAKISPFWPYLLAKSNRYGKRIILSHIILKCISDWSENQEPEEVKAIIPRPHKPPLNDDAYEKKRAILIAKKLEFGNF